MQQQAWHRPEAYYPLFDWKPDIERFSREVKDGCRRGRGDPLTLAEMECSLDLLDAELMAVRSRSTLDEEARGHLEKLTDLRGQLVRLIKQLRPHVPDWS